MAITQELERGEHFFVNSVSWMLGEEDSITVHAKSLSYDYLTMDSQTSALLKVLTVGVVPLVFLGIGIVIWVRRRQR